MNPEAFCDEFKNHALTWRKIKFTLDSYDELQKCLEEEMKILPKVFPELLISKTCISISTCWCMQGLMNVELDLLKRYTTLFAIRHLVDGGADQRLSQPCRGFATITGRNEEAISSPVDFITNIILKRSLPSASFIYGHWTKVSSYIFSNGWYELATYTMEESDGVFSKVHLHIGDVVTIHEEDSGEYKPRHSLEKIFPISIIDHVQKVHFVYDTKIDLWIKNNYYFTAI
ncbi:hypothetical protein GLOIN_2v1487024 [Rhizophagus clarus]|uniref:Uncharacterized protein n=1 Tax=Rhizophagus clarus TaxID=94130 RepID=A0A8H3LLA6_9GLOM|nr:hypothetical protein GLOIN_2v1487024 [Rhizophagus clarus]